MKITGKRSVVVLFVLGFLLCIVAAQTITSDVAEDETILDRKLQKDCERTCESLVGWGITLGKLFPTDYKMLCLYACYFSKQGPLQ